MVTDFTRYVLYYHELIGKIAEHEQKKYLMIDDYMLRKVMEKIKWIIDIEKFDNTELLIDTDHKIPDDITLKNIVMLITCVIKNDSKFYPQLERSIIRSIKYWQQISIA